MTPSSLEQVLELLVRSEVDFVLVGGLAAAAHGSIRATADVAVVYDRSPANLDRLVRALASHRPYLRGAPAGLPFRFDRPTLEAGLNFTLTTDLGDLDLLGEAIGVGGYRDLVPHSRPLEVFGLRCLCVDLDTLIHMKRAAGRPRDFEALVELEALREELDRAET